MTDTVRRSVNGKLLRSPKVEETYNSVTGKFSASMVVTVEVVDPRLPGTYITYPSMVRVYTTIGPDERSVDYKTTTVAMVKGSGIGLVTFYTDLEVAILRGGPKAVGAGLVKLLGVKYTHDPCG